MSPTGPVGEAFADHGFDVQEFMVVPEEHFHQPSVAARARARRPVAALLALGESP